MRPYPQPELLDFYDGVSFQVSLDGSFILTEAAGAVPSGNAGFRVKQVEGVPVTGFFEDIVVQ